MGEFNGSGAASGAASGASAGAAFGPWGAAIGGVAGGVLGSGILNGKKKNPAEEAAKEALAYYDSIGIPPIEAQKLVLEEIQSQGVLTPELENAIAQHATEMQAIATDPSLKKAQNDALANMQRRYTQGLTDEEQVNILDTRRDTNQQARAAQETILQNMAQRGMSGGGAELAAQLSAGQAGADRQAQADAKQAALMSAARQQAAETSGQMATQYRTQDFGEQAQKASAQDAINQFNTQNQQNVLQRNVGSKNDAQAANLGEKQRIADANVASRNAEQQYNKNLLQTQFENKMSLANAKAAARTGQIGNAFNQDQANKQASASQFQNLLGGASSAANAYSSYKTGQTNQTGNDIMNAKPSDKKYDSNGRLIA